MNGRNNHAADWVFGVVGIDEGKIILADAHRMSFDDGLEEFVFFGVDGEVFFEVFESVDVLREASFPF